MVSPINVMSTITIGSRVQHPQPGPRENSDEAVKNGARWVLHHYLYLRSISPVGVDAALSRRRSRVRVPYGPRIVRSPLVGDTSPRLSNSKADSLWQSCNRFESYPSYNKRMSYNGYYSSLPNWRREFDSLHPLKNF